ncbi:MAG TPA: DNA polymerase I [Acidobacteriota bacterium]|nr:DNA polymerase I [Acidobacteriota bacterium]
MSDPERLFIIDGHALAYRSFFALIKQPMTTSRGEDVRAVFGFATTLMSVIRDQQPEYLAVAFDPKGPTFRHEQYPQYKATRQKMPEEMRTQIPRIFELVEAFGVPTLQLEGVEADDVMASVAKKAEEQGIDVYLVTADKDFGQIVGPKVKMFNLRARESGVEIIDAEAIEEKFGVRPDQMLDLLSLMGDSSDNIPGVRGVGQKTASGLLQKYGSLEGVYEHLDDLGGKAVGKRLAEGREDAELSRSLIRLRTDVDCGKLDNLRWQAGFPQQAAELLKELEFQTLLGQVTELAEGGAIEKPEHDYRAVTTTAALGELIEMLKKTGSFCVDTETTSEFPLEAELVGLSFSVEEGKAFYVSLNHFEDLGSAEVLERLRPLLEDEGLAKTGQNIKYDALAMRNSGVRLRGIEFDTMIASYVLDPGARGHGLDILSLRHLDYKKIPTKELIGSGRKQITMAEVDLERIAEYACEDADYTMRLRQIFEPQLKEAEAEELFRELEMPLSLVLEEMEYVGIGLDTGLLGRLSGEFQKRLEELEGQIHDAAGTPFNINSPQQLGEILFDKLEVHRELKYKPKKTPTGQWRTDIDVLQSLQGHPLPAMILDWRQLSKLKGTYIDALPKLVNSKTGRLHTSFNQAIAATGRLSSSDPNLQNIPVRTEMGREIRRAFIPGEGFECLMSADYSQIELRIAAHFSSDSELVNAFKSGKDIHRETAAKVFNIFPEMVTREQRDFAKRINFGILYGMGPALFSKETGVSFKEAKRFIEDYLATFSGIRYYIERTLDEARRQGYVTTMLGRRRYLPELDSPNPGIRSHAENMAVNTPIQGSAADIIKRAMIDIQADIEREGLSSRMVLQVHDELVFEIAPGELERMREIAVRRMESAVELIVPVVVDTGTGADWLEAH